jgi:hypothetical protein
MRTVGASRGRMAVGEISPLVDEPRVSCGPRVVGKKRACEARNHEDGVAA